LVLLRRHSRRWEEQPLSLLLLPLLAGLELLNQCM
jgi:hypothetical protein